MAMPRLRHALLLCFLPIPFAAAACADASKAPADPSTAVLDGEARTYQQQASYPQGQFPAATATAAAQNGQPSAGLSLPGLNEPPATDLAGLESQLARAEQALGLALATPPAPTVSAKQGGDMRSSTTSGGAEGERVNACAIACAALASMKRSADHVCGMAGEKDGACGNARERVQRAEQRVLQACPACK